MKSRDRIVLMIVIVLVVLVGAWIKVVSPEREQASKLSAQVSTAQAQLTAAEGKLAGARTAESQYGTAYAAMVSLGKAVPSGQEVPSLIYQLSLASTGKRVQFASIGTAAAGSSSAGATAGASSTTSFGALPFTFVFEGSFFDLERLFAQLTSFTTRTASGDLRVSGRLLTIQSVKLSPASSSGGSSFSGGLTGTVTASAYTAPASQGLSAAGTGSPGAAVSPASSSAAASSATAPAIIKVNP